MKKHISLFGRFGVLSGAFLPVLVFAAGEKITTLEALVNKFITLIKYLVPLIFAIALVAFLWGIFQYFFSGAEKKEEAKDFLLYGIIGLFLMVSVWGLVRILTGTFLLENAQPNLPSLGVGSGASSGSTFNTNTVGGSGGGYYDYGGGATYPVRPTSGSGSGSSPFDSNAPMNGSGSNAGTGSGSNAGTGSGSNHVPAPVTEGSNGSTEITNP